MFTIEYLYAKLIELAAGILGCLFIYIYMNYFNDRD